MRRIVKLFNILSDGTFLLALFRGLAAGTEHLSVLRKIKCDFVVDIGANRGQFALVVRKIFPNACIHSFEPLDEPASIFETIFGAGVSPAWGLLFFAR